MQLKAEKHAEKMRMRKKKVRVCSFCGINKVSRNRNTCSEECRKKALFVAQLRGDITQHA